MLRLARQRAVVEADVGRELEGSGGTHDGIHIWDSRAVTPIMKACFLWEQHVFGMSTRHQHRVSPALLWLTDAHTGAHAHSGKHGNAHITHLHVQTRAHKPARQPHISTCHISSDIPSSVTLAEANALTPPAA